MMNRVRQFFYGRCGVDQLNMALLIISVTVSIISQIFQLPAIMIVYWVLLAGVIYRMFSKNLHLRSNENMRFLTIWRKVTVAVKLRIRMIKECQTHRYLKCPSCNKQLRVPKGRGKININCSRCHKNFEKKV